MNWSRELGMEIIYTMCTHYEWQKRWRQALKHTHTFAHEFTKNPHMLMSALDTHRQPRFSNETS